MKITEMPWIGAALAEKLAARGIVTGDELLAHAESQEGRLQLAAALGIREELVLGWVNRVDLLGIDGIDPPHVHLLAAAGIDGRAELARHDPVGLAATLDELNRTRATMPEPPAAAQVARWIVAARQTREAAGAGELGEAGED